MTITQLNEHIFVYNMAASHPSPTYQPSLLADLSRTLNHIASLEQAKVLILRGGEQVFNAGASKQLLLDIFNKNFETSSLNPLAEALLDFPLPVIAAMEGHAIGGGFLIGLYCDLTIGARESRYGFNFAEFGLTPGLGATQLLPQMIGSHFALEMLATARLYKGKELEGRGLFNQLVPKAEVMTAAVNLAQRLTERPRFLLTLLKSTLADPKKKLLASTSAREQELHALCFQQPETRQLIEDNYRT